MLEEEKMAPQEVKKRLLSTLQNWVGTVFFPKLIVTMKKSGIKEGSLTAKVISTNLSQYTAKDSIEILSSTTSTTASIYDAKATLASLWELTAPSGTVRRIIHFEVKAEICLADWEGVADFRVDGIVVEGSDFQCTYFNPVVRHRVSHHEISKQGKEALSLVEFDEEAVQEIAYFILLHFLPPIYDFLSQKAAEIENALIRTLATLPPLPLEFQGRVYTFKVKNVSKRAIKTFGSTVSVTEDSEYTEDELKVIVEGVLEENGMVREISFRIVVFVTLMEWRKRDGEANMVGRMNMGLNWVEGRGFPSPLQTLMHLHKVLEMEVENSKEGIEQFFAKVVEAINVEEIKKLIRKKKKLRK